MMKIVRALRTGLAAIALVAACTVVQHAAGNPSGGRALSSDALASIAEIATREIAAGHVPGAVVLIGQENRVVYRNAFGVRTKRPTAIPMTTDTVFDLASLTKVIATTTAVMQLVEQNTLALDVPASAYWPQFGAAGKSRITIRDLLTHYSGLPPDLNLARPWQGYQTAIAMLAGERPAGSDGTHYIYSDENFEALGEIVRLVTGTTLDRYCGEHIFEPLGMRDTAFRPSAAMANRLAPTSDSQAAGKSPTAVNDPTAQRMGGVAGHAGLFSTADDLAIFAAALLDPASAQRAVLRPPSIALMTHRASPAAGTHPRGLGWDLADPFDASLGATAPSFGHTGYTGTMLWVDPATRTYVIVLTNRTYPNGLGDAQPLRKAILSVVSAAVARLAA